MTKLVDLTQPWGDRMPTWPQFESIQVTDITTHHRDGKSTVLVRTNMHTGTHIDAPIHYWSTGKHLGEIPIGDLYGTGLVIDLRPITKPRSYYCSRRCAITSSKRRSAGSAATSHRWITHCMSVSATSDPIS